LRDEENRKGGLLGQQMGYVEKEIKKQKECKGG
jgi:hypothetical protein